jgi:hypothetical protein
MALEDGVVGYGKGVSDYMMSASDASTPISCGVMERSDVMGWDGMGRRTK